MNRLFRFTAPLLFGVTICFSLACFSLVPVLAAEQETTHQDSASVDSLMAGLSDEQVRQMLIEELEEDAAASQEVDPQRMKGPAYVLSRLLRALSSEHQENEDQLETLFAGIPDVLPDLYKVYLTL